MHATRSLPVASNQKSYRSLEIQQHLVAFIGNRDNPPDWLAQSEYSTLITTNFFRDWERIAILNPSLAIVEWQLPQVEGINVCRHLASAMPTLPIILLAPSDRVEQRIAGLNAGAIDCVAQPCDEVELLARVRARLRFANTPHNEILRCGDLILNRKMRQVYRDTQAIELTAKEFDLLDYLMNHVHQIVTRNQIIESVWGYEFIGESNVIEVYISGLRRKLESNNRKRLIHTVRNIGYVMQETSIS